MSNNFIREGKTNWIALFVISGFILAAGILLLFFINDSTLDAVDSYGKVDVPGFRAVNKIADNGLGAVTPEGCAEEGGRCGSIYLKIGGTAYCAGQNAGCENKFVDCCQGMSCAGGLCVNFDPSITLPDFDAMVLQGRAAAEYVGYCKKTADCGPARCGGCSNSAREAVYWGSNAKDKVCTGNIAKSKSCECQNNKCVAPSL